METDSHRQVKEYYGKWIPDRGYRNVVDIVFYLHIREQCFGLILREL